MSAPQIPNLLMMRGGLRGRGGRGRGRGRGGPLPPPDSSEPQPSPRHDKAIQATDSDAAVSRFSAVSLGYLDDPFATYFAGLQATRRLPVINRGTYTRTTALDLLIDAFIEPAATSSPNAPTRQILSLGAGTDTRYFRLRAQNQHQNVIYHEFDFPSVVATKYKIVDTHKDTLCKEEILFEKFPEGAGAPDPEAIPEWGLMREVDGQREARYICHPLDLRQLPKTESLKSFNGIRTDVPTLIISECCLCYLAVDVAADIVKWIVDKIPDAGIALYEPIGTDDSFGQMMVSNLAARGVVMPTVQKYKTLQDQKERLLQLGFSNGQEGKDVSKIWEEWVPTAEKERVDKLEGLDEVEEWLLLARHYGVVWAWRGTGFENWTKIEES
ncbi:leucine carboxyl methyltransferase [Phlyctema vagabunda]|uniref:Leucine carboxyl methyltransferase 1 n=1 Tax=Phlyctema vagabunda TaxID=108571 RepID=A0ABR4PVY1_9HELO